MTAPSDASRVALVTGGNRGLGRETCRQLIERGVRVVLSARRDAAEVAEPIGADPLDLDVTDEASVAAAVSTVRDRYGRLDVLVNNAGVALDGFDADVVARTLAVNVWGVVRMTDAFRPLLPNDGILVMVSSGMGELSSFPNARRSDFEEPSLSRERLFDLMREFLRDVESGEHARKGWPSSAYRVSKVGLNAFTRIVARELSDTAIRVNAVCPGWVRTDMGGRAAPRGGRQGSEWDRVGGDAAERWPHRWVLS